MVGLHSRFEYVEDGFLVHDITLVFLVHLGYNMAFGMGTKKVGHKEAVRLLD